MSWEKVGKRVVALLVVLGCVAAVRASLQDSAPLHAQLAYQPLTYPSQFNLRISQTNEALKYERLQADIRDIARGELGAEQVDKLVSLAQAPYAKLFAKPFEAGLVDHRTGLVIDLRNTSDQPLLDVRIRLPARGLVQVRDEAGNDRIPEEATNAIDIPSLAPEGVSKVWVYFDTDFAMVRQGGVTITHSGGKADMDVLETFGGVRGAVASNAWLLLTLLGGLVVSAGVLGRALLRVRSPSPNDR